MTHASANILPDPGSFESVRQEFEAKRKAQEAHSEAVEIARKNALYALAQEADAAMKRGKKGYKPVRSGLTVTGMKSPCEQNHGLIVKMLTDGKTYKEIALAVGIKADTHISQMTIYNYCAKQKINQGNRPTWKQKLLPHLEGVRKDVRSGFTRQELATKYKAPLSIMSEFLRAHGLSTAKKNRRFER